MQNLDFLCVAMILSKKADLLESDFSMCLGILMSFKEPLDGVVEQIINRAQRVREALLDKKQYVTEDSPQESDGDRNETAEATYTEGYNDEDCLQPEEVTVPD